MSEVTNTSALREALENLTRSVEAKLGTMDYYFGPNARTAVSGESRAHYNAIAEAVAQARAALAAAPEPSAAPSRRQVHTHWRIIDRKRGKTLPRRFDSREGAESIIAAAGRQGEWEAIEHNATGKLVVRPGQPNEAVGELRAQAMESSEEAE